MEGGVATATVDLDKLILDFSTWEEVYTSDILIYCTV